MQTMVPCTYPAHGVKNHVSGTMAAAACSVETKHAVKMCTITPTMKTSKSGAAPDGLRFDDGKIELGKGLYHSNLTIRNVDDEALGSIEYELCEWDGVSAIEIKHLTVEEAHRGKGNAAPPDARTGTPQSGSADQSRRANS